MNGSVYKIIELVGTSETSWETAAENAVAKATKSVLVPEYRFLLNTKAPDLSRYPLNDNNFVIILEIIEKDQLITFLKGVSIMAPLFSLIKQACTKR